ncbi:MAG: HAD family phosphatase [Phocaeicola sp.]|nr:HAD family phosphatase [Phocaeicola sp.]
MKFLFDLDGTVTSQETLPIIANHFGISKEMEELTKQTVQGNIPFVESFIRRVNILGTLPVTEVDELLGQVPLYPLVHQFIQEHPENCAVVTGNLDCWCKQLNEKVGCQSFCSHAIVEDNKVVKLEKILRKEIVVDHFRFLGETVVFVGDGNNDLEAMRHANFSIAVGLTHNPARSLLSIVDYIFYNEKALCRQLSQLL